MEQIYRVITTIAVTAGFGVSMLLSSSAVSANIPPSHYAIVLATVDKHIVPHFAALRDAAAAMPKAVDDVCAQGDDASRTALASAFQKTVEAWAGVEYLRFGPMTEGARRERMSFWPDPRRVMKRQLRAMIAAGDANSAGLDIAIAKQSAAVQGLPALEVLITDQTVLLGPGEKPHYRCVLAKAIAGNVKGIADALYNDWSKENGWRDKMLRPGSDNDTYREPQEAANELVKAFLTGLSLIGDGEVKPRLDANAKFQPPFEKSGLAQDYFVFGVRSLAALYEALDLEAFVPEEKAWVHNWTVGAWRTLLQSDGAGGMVAPAEGDAQSSAATAEGPPLRKVHGMFTGLRKIVLTELAPAAGLTVGFNELDGD